MTNGARHDSPCPDLIRAQEQLRAHVRQTDRAEARVGELAEGMRDYALAAKEIANCQKTLARRLDAVEEQQRAQTSAAVTMRGHNLLLLGSVITAAVSLLVALLSLWKG